jgi:hypothetical protein
MKAMIATTVALTIAFISVGCSSLRTKHTNDVALSEKFRSHQIEFNRLADIALEDKNIHSIAPNLVTEYDRAQGWRSVGTEIMLPDRWAEYRKLFTDLDLPRGIVKNGPSISIMVDPPSISNGDSSKGYTYSIVPLAVCPNNDLEVCLPAYGAKARNGNVIAYRALSANWYLYLYYG